MRGGYGSVDKVCVCERGMGVWIGCVSEGDMGDRVCE